MEGASSLLLSTKKKHHFRHKTKKETKQNYPSDRSGMTFRLWVLLADICRTKRDAVDSDSFFLSLKFLFSWAPVVRSFSDTFDFNRELSFTSLSFVAQVWCYSLSLVVDDSLSLKSCMNPKRSNTTTKWKHGHKFFDTIIIKSGIDLLKRSHLKTIKLLFLC